MYKLDPKSVAVTVPWRLDIRRPISYGDSDLKLVALLRASHLLYSHCDKLECMETRYKETNLHISIPKMKFCQVHSYKTSR